MIRPGTLWAGQSGRHKIADFGVTTARNVIIVRGEGHTVDDIPIRSDGLSMQLRIRDLEHNYYLNRAQLGEGCILELTITGGLL